jgi:hypothetical protein
MWHLLKDGCEARRYSKGLLGRRSNQASINPLCDHIWSQANLSVNAGPKHNSDFGHPAQPAQTTVHESTHTPPIDVVGAKAGHCGGSSTRSLPGGLTRSIHCQLTLRTSL